MDCLTNSGIHNLCDKSSGGLINIWITSYNNLTDKDLLEYDADGVLTAITSAFSATTEFFHYDTEKETAYANEEPTFEGIDGSTGYDVQLYMKFKKIDASKRNEMKFLTSSKTIAIVEDRVGNYRILGIDGGLTASSIRSQSGAAIGESNGYEVTLNDQAVDLVPNLESKSVFSALLAA